MIDQHTIDRIIEAANIVEVVSDFVTLRRRGVNYVGLCPFHDEKTPSFSVSPARGICKCFSCGKGGNSVHFIMEHEQVSYYEALKYLARKYNIEIQERQLSEEEKQRKSDRESMLIVNDFAQKFFTTNLLENVEGRSIGLGYFRERGFGEDIIKKFGLGYSPEKRDALAQEALKKGYKKDYLLKTGLCIESQQGVLYDRYKGRVIFPIHSLSGKVIAFGGRILKKDERAAKYVNSPESEVYHKSDVLYGIYHAKQAIVKNDFCYLVEGYTDVLSMHQAGIENVVASSGTSLTPGQIRLIHRFTNNITVLYDGDAAGIKASLRGIDLILQEGLNIKVVLLPDGDDPDSFSKKQSAADFTAYIRAHETDFIRFKTNLLLEGAGNDPIKRATLIGDIVRSIAIIPDNILRTIYVQDCARLLSVDEKMLMREVNNIHRDKREQEIANTANKYRQQREKQNYPAPSYPSNISHNSTSSTQSTVDVPPPLEAMPEPPIEAYDTPATTTESVTLPPLDQYTEPQPPADDRTAPHEPIRIDLPTVKKEDKIIEECERTLARYILRYGYAKMIQYDENGETSECEVIDYIVQELAADEVTISHPIYARIIHEAQGIDRQLARNYGDIKQEQSLPRLREALQVQLDEINSKDDADEKLLKMAEERFLNACEAVRYEAEIAYIGHSFINSPDMELSSVAIDLMSDRHQLSKIHTKYQVIERDVDRLNELIPRAVFELKDAILMRRIDNLRNTLRHLQSANANDEVIRVMEQIAQYMEMRKSLALYLGERIIPAKNK
ncbi:MAG: DNA primase [Bacteroidaceae bacterium]|nr:DNA primase [Bacteroidaceae bacterium]